MARLGVRWWDGRHSILQHPPPCNSSSEPRQVTLFSFNFASNGGCFQTCTKNRDPIPFDPIRGRSSSLALVGCVYRRGARRMSVLRFARPQTCNSSRLGLDLFSTKTGENSRCGLDSTHHLLRTDQWSSRLEMGSRKRRTGQRRHRLIWLRRQGKDRSLGSVCLYSAYGNHSLSPWF